MIFAPVICVRADYLFYAVVVCAVALYAWLVRRYWYGPYRSISGDDDGAGTQDKQF